MPAIHHEAAVVEDFQGSIRYPWKVWSADRKTRRFTRGKHFHVSPHHFVVAAHNWARRNGYKVKTRQVSDKSVELQFVPTKAS